MLLDVDEFLARIPLLILRGDFRRFIDNQALHRNPSWLQFESERLYRRKDRSRIVP